MFNALSYSLILDEKAALFRNVQLLMMHSGGTPEQPIKTRWWEIREECDDENYEDILRRIPYIDCDSIIIYAFNDKVFPATLNIITAGG